MVRHNTDSPRLDLDLRTILYQEGKFHIAHCLELDLVGEGETAQEAVTVLSELIDAQIQAALEDGDLAGVFHPAPAELWKLYAMGKSRRGPRLKRPVSRHELRQLVLN